MGNVVSQQLAMFLRSILLGACLGLVYDLLRVLRRLGGQVWGGLLDAAYCVTASVSLAFFVLAGDGELRLFFLLGAAGGAVLYFCLLSALLLPLWELWLEILLSPFRAAAALLKKAEKFFRKLFSFGKNRFTIIVKTHRRSGDVPPEGERDGRSSECGQAAPEEKAETRQQQADAPDPRGAPHRHRGAAPGGPDAD